MKKIITMMFVISMLSLMIPVNAEPITQISVADNWIYTIISDDYTYDVIEVKDVKQSDGTWVEVNKIETNESFVWEDVIYSLIDDLGQNVTIQTNSLILNDENNFRYHSARGNFLVKAHQEGDYNAIITVDGVENLMTGAVVFDMFYHDFDLQEPIVTGNPLYVNQSTNIYYTVDGSVENMTMNILTTHRIDGSDAYDGVYNESIITLRDVFIEPKYRWVKFFYSNATTSTYVTTDYRDKTVVGLPKETWSFSSEIGLPVEYTTEPVIGLTAVGLMSTPKTYTLKDYNVDLSTWSQETSTEPTEPIPTEPTTDQTNLILGLSLLMATYIMFYIKKKRP